MAAAVAARAILRHTAATTPACALLRAHHQPTGKLAQPVDLAVVGRFPRREDDRVVREVLGKGWARLAAVLGQHQGREQDERVPGVLPAWGWHERLLAPAHIDHVASVVEEGAAVVCRRTSFLPGGWWYNVPSINSSSKEEEA